MARRRTQNTSKSKLVGTQIPAFVINRPESGWTAAAEYAVPMSGTQTLTKTAWGNGYDAGANNAQWGEGYESGENGRNHWNKDDYQSEELDGTSSWGPGYHHANMQDSKARNWKKADYDAGDSNRPILWSSIDYSADGRRDVVRNSAYVANTDISKHRTDSSHELQSHGSSERAVLDRVPHENATYEESTESTL